MRRSVVWCVAAGILAAIVGCGGSDRGPNPGNFGVTPRTGTVSTNAADYPVIVHPDSGADPSVPAEQGGRGFTGAGWQTNASFDLIGDPRALKGGLFREALSDFPGNIRLEGPESNTLFNYTRIRPLVYETLLTLHPTTLEYIPALATHWQISPDQMTYRFRIDPNARFSDGTPVTAEDVVASWQFFMDPGLQAPMAKITWEKFKTPVAESKYIVRVTSSQLNWQNFLAFSTGLFILPAHALKDVNGAKYITDYNFKLLPGTGPYIIGDSDIDKGNSITLRKRTDYWAENDRRNIGVNNFAEIRNTVVRDRNLEFEMFKRGDLDYYLVNRAQMWAEDMDFDKIKSGVIQKRKIYNHNPGGIQGMAFNTRRPPFDDVRVREALFHLYNRQELIDKLMFGQYELENSYFPGSVYENPNDPKVLYDPAAALKLLADAGWKDHDAQGRLVKNGKPFTVEIVYADQAEERYLTVFQEDLRKVGITLNLRLVTPETQFKLEMDRQFDMTATAWGGEVFPDPETIFSSTLADPGNTNNITGLKNARLDQILADYDKMFVVKDRIAAVRQVDSIVANQFDYILEWTAPFQRIGYWNKFGQPKGYITRVGDYTDMASLWWIEPDLAQQVQKGMSDASVKMPVGETDNKYWLDFARTEDQTAPPKTP